MFARGRATSICSCSAPAATAGSLPDALRDRFRALKINVEVTRTGTAVSTYNILLGEGRRVAAGLIAVD